MEYISFSCFPRTLPPPEFVVEIVNVFRKHEKEIASEQSDQHLQSDAVLRILYDDLVNVGFEVEAGKKDSQKIRRPVYFGENGVPEVEFQVDAFHSKWKCGLEIESIRAIQGSAFYRDLIQALVMVNVDHLCIGVPKQINYGAGKQFTDRAYDTAVRMADVLFGHSRFQFPYGLTLIGY